MDNQTVLSALSKIPELRINRHEKNELYNVECITRNPHHRRKNIVGDINPGGRSFILYNNGKWVSKNKLGIQNLDQLLEWVKKDIDHLSR
ncbi:hypothetical protein CD30_13055 [Ureibacillus massiliensis 4400831 = CIP 108448 = CCUG 49529]|uniref:Uncharacterized protein n=1 Tax=Ureibacillus massiliensis 4400831 = CIP 108448 = CCUG 49529 TaxID=1211035 RepID=A0A0A3IZG3_9BACL|nr:hypothetical protein [Ureibacillus massiliensis]KGR90174.1 hypothetical protein CD30_13055 [Ureibacillus massiliensis 4400831 = CIP 108448 = CCUG 49529]